MTVLKLKACKHGNTDECLACYDEEIARLRDIEAAARNLVAQKGRHNTEQAYQRLAALLMPNDKVAKPKTRGQMKWDALNDNSCVGAFARAQP